MPLSFRSDTPLPRHAARIVRVWSLVAAAMMSWPRACLVVWQGGPGTATSLMSYQVYVQGFRVLNFGYASALSMGMFGMVLIVGLIGFFFLRRAWARL